MAADLSNLQLLKAYVGYSATDRDVVYGQLITEVSQAIRTRLNQTITAATYTVVLDAPCTPVIVLGEGPVKLAGLTVYYNYQAYGNPAAFTSTNLLTLYQDYYLDVSERDNTVSKSRRLIYLQGAWGANYYRAPSQLSQSLIPTPGAVKVTYSAGFDTVPTDVTMATNLACQKLFMARDRGAMPTSESLTGYSYSLPATATAYDAIGSADVWAYLVRYSDATCYVG